MRLIKLAAYALFGYVLYELFLGISVENDRQKAGSKPVSRSQRELNRAMNENQGRMRMAPGSSPGEAVSTTDNTGASSTHNVGRGVVSR